MYNQDDNKRLTVDSASFNYSHLVSSLLYVDRDELLFCPEGSYQVERQRKFQHDLFNKTLFGQHVDQILFQRFNYASVVKIPLSTSPFQLSDQYIQQALESCVENAYQRRSIFAYFHCFSSVTTFKTKEKSLFQVGPGTCPFHELHDACLRCKCKSVLMVKPNNPKR
jgi:hypothetical protein